VLSSPDPKWVQVSDAGEAAFQKLFVVSQSVRFYSHMICPV
jgi:hypothetical protein